MHSRLLQSVPGLGLRSIENPFNHAMFEFASVKENVLVHLALRLRFWSLAHAMPSGYCIEENG